MISLYVVTKLKIVTAKDMKFLTIATNKKDCNKYITKRLMMEHNAHYVPWCELRKLNPEDIKSWKLYVNTTDNVDTKKYVIRKMSYKLSDLATILRLYNCCIPLGCGYESDNEYFVFSKYLGEFKKQGEENNVRQEQENINLS